MPGEVCSNANPANRANCANRPGLYVARDAIGCDPVDTVNEHPPTRRLSSDTRICVVLTLAEASALVTQFQLDPQAAALNGFVKILTALQHVTAEVARPPSSALDVPPLRAKHYRRRTEALRMAKAILPATVSIETAAAVPEPLRMAKAVMRPKVPTTRSRRAAPAPELDDDYVPYRDEADGIYT